MNSSFRNIERIGAAAAHNGFVVATGEEFLALQKAIDAGQKTLVFFRPP